MIVAALYVAVAGVTIAIARADPAHALAASAPALAVELAVGALLVAAALSLKRTRFSISLAATAIALPLAEWNSPAAGVVFSVGLLAWAVWPALLAAAALWGPWDRSLGRFGLAVLALAAITSGCVLGVASAVVFDPAGRGCVDCPANALQLTGDTRAGDALARGGLGLTILWTTLAALLVLHHLRSLSPPRRLLAAPVLVPAVAALLLHGLQVGHGLRRGFISNDPTDQALWMAQLAALALVAAGVAAAHIHHRRVRSRVAQLVIELGSTPSSDGLRDRLAAALGDPGLALVHRSDDAVGWIDREGRDAVPAGEQEMTPIVADGRPLSALVHRRGLLDDPALVTEIAGAARLALEHERLHALHRARLAQLQASRARLVAAAESERRRLERDLHDGAQQRLVALALEIRLARRRHPELDPGLALAENELRETIAALRDLARGLYPTVLADEGLAAALESLAEEDRRLALGALAEGRFPEGVESTAYFVVADTLQRGDVAIDTRVAGRCLIVELHAPGPPSDRVEDRVGAVGGTCLAEADRLVVELPCAS